MSWLTGLLTSEWVLTALAGFLASFVTGLARGRRAIEQSREDGARAAEAAGKAEAEKQERDALAANPNTITDDELFRDEPARLIEVPHERGVVP